MSSLLTTVMLAVCIAALAANVALAHPNGPVQTVTRSTQVAQSDMGGNHRSTQLLSPPLPSSVRIESADFLKPIIKPSQIPPARTLPQQPSYRNKLYLHRRPASKLLQRRLRQRARAGRRRGPESAVDRGRRVRILRLCRPGAEEQPDGGLCAGRL